MGQMTELVKQESYACLDQIQSVVHSVGNSHGSFDKSWGPEQWEEQGNSSLNFKTLQRQNQTHRADLVLTETQTNQT